MTEVTLWIQVSANVCGRVVVPATYAMDEVINVCYERFNSILKEFDPLSFWLDSRKGVEDSCRLKMDLTVEEFIADPNYSGKSSEHPLHLCMQDIEKPRVKKLKTDPTVDWINQTEIPCVISCHKLHFVQRKESFDALKQIHEATYTRRVEGSGKTWTIPFADNIFGAGKSLFAMNYVKMFQEAYPDKKTEFESSVSNSRSIRLVFELKLFNHEKQEASMINILRNVLEKHIDQNVSFLQKDFNSSAELLKELVSRGGPVFLILDEIGKLFMNSKTEKNTQMFWDFISNVVVPWFEIQNLYFIVLGCGEFLRTMPLITKGSTIYNTPFCIQRIPLFPLQSPAIMDILRFTKISEYDDRTLMQYFGIEESQLSKVASKLFKKTGGTPRTLAMVLSETTSLHQLMHFEEKMPEIDLKTLDAHVNNYRGKIQQLLYLEQMKAPVDLSEEFSGNDVETAPLYQIASDAGFTWEGDIDHAILHISNPVRKYLQFAGLNLTTFFQAFHHQFNTDSDAPNFFKWICIMRLMELLAKPCTPSEVHLQTMDTRIMGNFDDLYFNPILHNFPIVTEDAEKNATLQSTTVSKDCLAKVMEEAYCSRPISFVSQKKSNMCDGLFFTNAKFYGHSKKVVVGVFVDKEPKIEITLENVLNEAQKFNEMFQGMTEKHEIMKIFIFITAKFCAEMVGYMEGHTSRVYPKEDKKLRTTMYTNKLPSNDPNLETKVDEIILMNLKDEMRRCMFFGRMHSGYEMWIVEKIVRALKE